MEPVDFLGVAMTPAGLITVLIEALVVGLVAGLVAVGMTTGLRR